MGETISGKPFIVDIKNIKATLVDENSVSQLCGYDAEGNEVYEGDTLVLGGHNDYIAGVRPVSYFDNKKYFKPEKDFSDYYLSAKKENINNETDKISR